MIGLIMLMGVATKNSILLVEYAIMARKQKGQIVGMPHWMPVPSGSLHSHDHGRNGGRYAADRVGHRPL